MRVKTSPKGVTRSVGVSSGLGSYFAGLDVSVETTSICVVDSDGRPVLETEAKTASQAIARALRPYRRLLRKVGHETTSDAARLHKELLARRLPVVCLDARLTRAALAGQRNKTDRNDARDIAVLLARGH